MQKKSTPQPAPVNRPPTIAATTAAHASDLAQIRAALGVPEFTDVQGIVQQIAKLRAIQTVDPVYAAMYREKIEAGLPPKIADIATRKQLAHDARLAAESAKTAQSEAASARTLRAVDQFSARHRGT